METNNMTKIIASIMAYQYMYNGAFSEALPTGPIVNPDIFDGDIDLLKRVYDTFVPSPNMTESNQILCLVNKRDCKACTISKEGKACGDDESDYSKKPNSPRNKVLTSEKVYISGRDLKSELKTWVEEFYDLSLVVDDILQQRGEARVVYENPETGRKNTLRILRKTDGASDYRWYTGEVVKEQNDTSAYRIGELIEDCVLSVGNYNLEDSTNEYMGRVLLDHWYIVGETEITDAIDEDGWCLLRSTDEDETWVIADGYSTANEDNHGVNILLEGIIVRTKGAETIGSRFDEKPCNYGSWKINDAFQENMEEDDGHKTEDIIEAIDNNESVMVYSPTDNAEILFTGYNNRNGGLYFEGEVIHSDDLDSLSEGYKSDGWSCYNKYYIKKKLESYEPLSLHDGVVMKEIKGRAIFEVADKEELARLLVDNPRVKFRSLEMGEHESVYFDPDLVREQPFRHLSSWTGKTEAMNNGWDNHEWEKIEDKFKDKTPVVCYDGKDSLDRDFRFYDARSGGTFNHLGKRAGKTYNFYDEIKFDPSWMTAMLDKLED